MPKLLLFNLEGEKLAKIRAIACRLGLDTLAVPREDFHRPLGSLLDGVKCAPAEGADFDDEMLVMETLSSPLLEALRAEGVPVALKAIVTVQNRLWSPAALCRELRREHEALRTALPKKHVHQHKKRK